MQEHKKGRLDAAVMVVKYIKKDRALVFFWILTANFIYYHIVIFTGPVVQKTESLLLGIVSS